MQSTLEQADPVWMFRVARRVSTDERMPPEEETARAREQASQSKSLSAEVVRNELEQMLLGRGVHLALQWLHECGVLAVWLPELEATVDFSQEAGRRHKDVWEHTKQVVAQAEPRPAVRWAALLHDIGKVRTRAFTSDGKVTFHRHSEVGARMFDDIGPRLGFDGPTRRTLRFLILHHLRPNQYLESWTDSAVRRFTKEMGSYLPDLLDLSRADITSRRPGRRQQAILNIDALADRLARLRAEDAELPLL